MNTKQEYKRAFEVVREVVHAWDPYCLIAHGAPRDEFDHEVACVVAQIPRIDSAFDAALARGWSVLRIPPLTAAERRTLATTVLARYANGSLGTFESTRYARGHKALYTLEINGERGSFTWDLHDLNRVEWFDHSKEGRLRGWTSILVTDGEHPYLGKWWVPGLTIGYEHSFVHQAADFLEGLKTGKPCSPTFREALETSKVCDAIIKSGQTEKWVKV